MRRSSLPYNTAANMVSNGCSTIIPLSSHFAPVTVVPLCVPVSENPVLQLMQLTLSRLVPIGNELGQAPPAGNIAEAFSYAHPAFRHVDD
jgi:hypothetical protein